MKKDDFFEFVKECVEQVRNLNDSADSVTVQQTRERLERQSYSPTLILSASDYLSFSKKDVIAEIERVAALSDAEMSEAGFKEGSDYRKIKTEHINLLIYHFRQLVRLRKDEPEAWGEVDELFGDD